MKVSILVLCPSQTDATSFYRGMGPLSHLRRHFPGDLNLMVVNQFNWPTMAMADIMFMQRPFNDDHVLVAQMAKSLGKPLWVDYDDDLFCVPTDNPAFRIYGKEAIQKNIAKIVAMADAVTVSTKNLKSRLETLNSNIHVVPNALNEEMFGYRDEEKILTNKLVFWRGSDTHQRDLATFSNEIIDVGRTKKDWTFTFVGYNPWFVTEFIPKERCLVGQALDVIEYHRFIHATRPAIFMVPLHNSDFNQSKSNIAWLEAMFAGSLALVPGWPEWSKPGAFMYSTPEMFKASLEKFIDDFETRHDDFVDYQREGWNYVLQNLSLKVVNHKRVEIIKELLA